MFTSHICTLKPGNLAVNIDAEPSDSVSLSGWHNNTSFHRVPIEWLYIFFTAFDIGSAATESVKCPTSGFCQDGIPSVQTPLKKKNPNGRIVWRKKKKIYNSHLIQENLYSRQDQGNQLHPNKRRDRKHRGLESSTSCWPFKNTDLSGAGIGRRTM